MITSQNLAQVGFLSSSEGKGQSWAFLFDSKVQGGHEMKESGLWATMKKGVSRFGDFQRIESVVGSGVPDVNYCVGGNEGWIELKHVKAWPKRSRTNVPIEYRSEQPVWWYNRRKAGGRVWVFIQVGSWYGLFDPGRMQLAMTQEQCRELATASWEGSCDWRAFIRSLALTQCPPQVL